VVGIVGSMAFAILVPVLIGAFCDALVDLLRGLMGQA
jgi:hypothetical protein